MLLTHFAKPQGILKNWSWSDVARSKNINNHKSNNMNDTRDPCQHKKTLWGKSKGIHKTKECHSNAGDVEGPICVGFVHMKKGM